MTAVSRFIYNFFINILSTVLSAVLGIISIPFLIKFLGTEQFGLIVLFSSIFGIASLIEGGINTAIIRELSLLVADADYDNFNKIFSFSINIGIFLTLSLTLLSMLWSENILSVFSKIPEELFPLASKSMWICILNLSITAFVLPVILALFSTKHRFDFIAIFRSSIVGGQVLAWFFVLTFTNFGFIGWAMSTLLVTVTISIIALILGAFQTKYLRYRFVIWESFFLNNILVVSAKVSFFKVSAFSMTYMNPILFSTYGSIVMNTVFQSATKGVLVMYMVLQNFSSQIIPHIANDIVKNDVKHIAILYTSISRIIFSISVFVVAIAIANYKYIFYLWLHNSMPELWLHTGNVFICLFFIQIFITSTDFQRTILTTLNKINEITIFHLMQAIIVVFSIVILLKYTNVGVYSVVLVHLPISIISLLFYMYLLRKYIGVSILTQLKEIFSRGAVSGVTTAVILVCIRSVVDLFEFSIFFKLCLNLLIDIIITLPILWFFGCSANDRSQIMSISLLAQIKQNIRL